MKAISKILSFSALASAIVVSPSIAFAAEVVLQKAPPLSIRQVPSYPENLARYNLGADVRTNPESAPIGKLQLSFNGQDQNSSAAALLCDDPTTGYQLPAGPSSLLVSLSSIENIQSVSFLNDGGQGHVTISVSDADLPANSPEWHNLGENSIADGAFSAKIGPGEAKYIRLNFDLTRSGRIAALGVYATPALSDFTMPRPRKVSFEPNSTTFALINFNFSDVHARARGLYVSSGDASHVNNMLDDQPATAYEFAKGDKSPTAIIDLGRERNLSRLSAVYSTQPGSVDFYVLRDLPGQASDEQLSSVKPVANVGQGAELPSALRISEQDFAGLRAVGSVVNVREGRASVNFPEMTGRYVMVKWHPASINSEPFSIAQVAAFGPAKRVSGKNQDVENIRGTDGKEAFDGKSILDNKDIPAEGPGDEQSPAEGPPPALPGVPPFTFIPQAPPTSP